MAIVLVVGYGRVGSIVANNIEFAKEDIAIIDSDPIACARAKNDGFCVIESSLQSDEELISAGIGSSIVYLYCVSGNDEVNIFITLSARFLDPNLQIMARAENANSKAKLKLAGANDTIDFNAIGAHKISSFLTAPLAYQLIEGVIYSQSEIYSKYKLIMQEVAIGENSPMAGKSILLLNFKQDYNVILIGIYNKKYGFRFNIDKSNHTISKHDVLALMGASEDIAKLSKALQA